MGSVRKKTEEKREIMDNLEERITELEIRFAHQDRLLDELNVVIAECDRRIVNLEAENRRLRDTLKTLAPELAESPDE